jgi:hypothetical protein
MYVKIRKMLPKDVDLIVQWIPNKIVYCIKTKNGGVLYESTEEAKTRNTKVKC